MHIRISRRSLLVLSGTVSLPGRIARPRSARAAVAQAADLANTGNKPRILVINPNSSQATTDMMVRIAQSVASENVEIVGATAPHSPSMIIDPDALAASGPQVAEIGANFGKSVSGIIISAFGDPGIDALRRQVSIPVVGIAEAAMLSASNNGRRFGVATTTPKLVASIDARAAELGLASLYTGVRLTPDDPNKLVTDPGHLVEALRQAVSASIQIDKAEAVIIGGGPLGNAATALQPMFTIPVIAPIPEAVHRLMGLLGLPRT